MCVFERERERELREVIGLLCLPSSEGRRWSGMVLDEVEPCSSVRTASAVNAAASEAKILWRFSTSSIHRHIITSTPGMEAPAVGIDLGTTYSVVGVWKKNKVEIIANDMGNRITPSCVAFNDDDRLIGEGAANQAVRNPTNTVFDAKRLIGRRFNDECVQSDRERWPFKVIAGEADKPSVVVNYMNQEKHFTAEEISSMILLRMKEIASKFVGSPVKKAVVTVPAYFNNSQRQATKDAATIAGLDVLQILNEPTAAALAYSLDNKDNCRGGEKLILVFDLGGGTFDVSLLRLDGHGVVEVKATSGDTHLGGQDFDNRMVDHLLKILREKYKEDLSKDYKCVRKLKEACERAKRMLSTETMTNIYIDSLYKGDDFSFDFSEARFVDINNDLFNKCIGLVKQCLEGADVDKKNINEVVLVGGSTRIPKIQELLQRFFEGKKPYKSINVDEAVAYGAAIQAAILNGDKKDLEAPPIALLDVTPLSLGTDICTGVTDIVIPKNTRIPCVMERVYVTAKDNQTSMGFKILEGERKLIDDNNLLGQFVVSGIRPRSAGKIKFKCIFSMDANGILTVTARNEDNKEEKGMTITRDKLTLNQDEIDRMIREARVYQFHDMERKAAMLRMY